MISYGIPLDSTYTGKAFYGMERYLAERGVRDKCVLFLHTGGTPLFFDDLPSLADSREDGA
jgi:D-cysteine desulfhydrase